MINGRLALGGLSFEFGNAKARFDELAAEVGKMVERHGKLLDDERGVLEELARLYLPELSPDAVSGGLRELRRELEEALLVQATRRDELGEEITRAEVSVATEAGRVEALEGEEEELGIRLERSRRAVEDELASDRDHAARVDEHETLMSRQALLKGRRARLASAGNLESRRYEAFRPFAYLLARGYGGPEHRAGFITRWLDRWLARRVDFEGLHHNYRILKEGPRAVLTEIEALRERAAELEISIDARAREASERLGLVRALAAVAAADKRLAAARTELERARARVDALRTELRAVEARRGGPYEEALGRHREFLEDQTIQDLVKRARATPDPRDDTLVGHLDDLRRRIEESGRELAVHRAELERLGGRAGKLSEAERLAARLFTSRRSRFRDDFRVEDVVEPLVQGTDSVQSVLHRIAEAHLREPLLTPLADQFGGWFAELSSAFDEGVDIVTIESDAEVEADYVVYDAEGRIIERRVTRRGGLRDYGDGESTEGSS